jgi:hypothetical protein
VKRTGVVFEGEHPVQMGKYDWDSNPRPGWLRADTKQQQVEIRDGAPPGFVRLEINKKQTGWGLRILQHDECAAWYPWAERRGFSREEAELIYRKISNPSYCLELGYHYYADLENYVRLCWNKPGKLQEAELWLARRLLRIQSNVITRILTRWLWPLEKAAPGDPFKPLPYRFVLAPDRTASLVRAVPYGWSGGCGAATTPVRELRELGYPDIQNPAAHQYQAVKWHTGPLSSVPVCVVPRGDQQHVAIPSAALTAEEIVWLARECFGTKLTAANVTRVRKNLRRFESYVGPLVLRDTCAGGKNRRDSFPCQPL